MSQAYRYVSWNRFKLVYDLVVLLAITAYIYLFVTIAPQFWEGPRVNGPVIQMRAYGTCAFLLLTAILCIGPLARLNPRFLPLLYNRRHLGVITCGVALLHAKKVIDWYYSFSPESSLQALAYSMGIGLDSVSGFSFEFLGLIVIIVLCLMAATSHDFWLKFLTPKVWKALHMAIYPAYGLLVLHVALGAAQSDWGPGLALLVGVSLTVVIVLHLLTGLPEARHDKQPTPATDGWIDAGLATEIPTNRARIVTLESGERVAIFRYDGKLSALSNVCAHQNGPLGEGRIIDGCVTCPWHGYQYRPHDGTSPPPFDEKVATYRLALRDGRVLLDPEANPPGTPVPPVTLEA